MHLSSLSRLIAAFRQRRVSEEHNCSACAGNVRLGDRTTARKASEETPLLAAGVFMSVHGPGIITVSSDSALAVGLLRAPGAEKGHTCGVPQLSAQE
jgi:hypothetical protein